MCSFCDWIAFFFYIIIIYKRQEEEAGEHMSTFFAKIRL